MSTYRGPQRPRQFRQQLDILKYAGHTAIWRQYISATTGTQDAGLGDTLYYREQWVSALFGGGPLGSYGPAVERQAALGMITSDGIQAVTRQKLGVRDELVWRGEVYRIESESVPSLMDGFYMTELARGEANYPIAAEGPDLALPTTSLLYEFYAGNGLDNHASVTTASGSGSAASAWADLGSSSYDLTKAGAGTILYHRSVPAFNEKGALQFDGAAYLGRTVAAGVLANLNAYNLFVVFATGNTAAEAYYSEGSSSSNNPQLYVAGNESGSGRASFSHRDDALTNANVNTSGSVNDGTVHMMTLRRTATDAFSLRVDGVEVGTDTDAPSTTTIDQLTIGALRRTAIQYYVTGYIALVAAYSTDNYATIEPLLAAHYGI